MLPASAMLSGWVHGAASQGSRLREGGEGGGGEGEGGGEGGGAASPPARVCAREVRVVVVKVKVVVKVGAPRHLRLAFARGR